MERRLGRRACGTPPCLREDFAAECRRLHCDQDNECEKNAYAPKLGQTFQRL